MDVNAPLTTEATRHLLRRFAFAATPAAEAALVGAPAGEIVTRLFADARAARQPERPPVVREEWTNSALRAPGTPDAQYEAARAAQLQSAQRDTETLRQWWIGEMVESPAPLRENLVLFFHGLFGSTTTAVDIPHAVYGCNALLRGACLGTIPALLEALVLDPAMMIQIGMDEHRRARVSDRPAKLILDHWSVGPGQYTDSDVEALSRALTGWTLSAPTGRSPAAADPGAVRPARRPGLTPVFDAQQFDARPKTLLGSTRDFDARSAIQFLAQHPSTATRFSRELVRYFGIEDPQRDLERQLAVAYTKSGGSIEALLRTIATSDQFWSSDSRWALIKSPVHLAVGACRQLEMARPPVEVISRWLTATGQTLFDTPNAGEGGWPGDKTWVTPPDRLAVRYQLPVVLSGRLPDLGMRPQTAPGAAKQIDIQVGPGVGRASADTLVDRLDPAPGLDRRAVTKGNRNDIIRRVMMTPQYQLA